MTENRTSAPEVPSPVPGQPGSTGIEAFVQELRAHIAQSHAAYDASIRQQTAYSGIDAHRSHTTPNSPGSFPSPDSLRTAARQRETVRHTSQSPKPSSAARQRRVAAPGDARQVNSEIYKALLAACDPPPQEDWFLILRISRTVRRGASDPEQLLQKLRQTYSDEQLSRAGVAVPSKEHPGEFQLHPDLGPSKTWVALSKSDGFFEVIAEGGCLQTARPALLMAAYDSSFRKGLYNSGTAFVTLSVRDMVLLRSLGLAACTAHGLDTLARDNLSRFRKRLGAESFDVGHVLENTHVTIDRLVLVGWSIEHFDTAEPPGFAAVIAHLKALHQHLGMPIHSIRVWRPAKQECQQLRFAMHHAGLPSDVTKIILDMAERSPRLMPAPAPPQVSIADTYRHVFRAASSKHMFLAEHAHKLQELFQDFSCRLMREAEACVDRQEANCKFMIAQLSNEVQLRLAQRQTQVLSKLASGQTKEDREDLDDILRVTKQIESLVRTINRCAASNPLTGRFPLQSRFGMS